MKEKVTAAFASAALAFFSLALQASRSRRQFCRILRSFWKRRKMGLRAGCLGAIGERKGQGIIWESNLFAKQEVLVRQKQLLAGVWGMAVRDTG